MKTAVFSASGAKKEPVTLDNAVFGQTPNQELLSLAYRQTLANRRTNNAKTQTRGLVSGGGKKPWRQKGTGNARTGSIRNPLWRGGGIIFGPTGIENYRINLPKKMSRAAVRQALSAQAQSVRVIEKFEISDGKTRSAAALLDKLEAEGAILLVVSEPSELARRAVANLAGVTLISPSQLSVFAILNADLIIIDQAALKALSDATKATPKPRRAKSPAAQEKAS